MKFLRTRKLFVLLMLACAGAQTATGSALLATALTLGLHGSHHAHSVAVVAAEGHLHLVLSHDAGAEHDHDAFPHPGVSLTSFSEGDHVFDLEETATATPRRAGLDPAPPLAMVVTTPAAPAPPWVVHSPPEPRARGVDHRTVVLRL